MKRTTFSKIILSSILAFYLILFAITLFWILTLPENLKKFESTFSIGVLIYMIFGILLFIFSGNVYVHEQTLKQATKTFFSKKTAIFIAIIGFLFLVCTIILVYGHYILGIFYLLLDGLSSTMGNISITTLLLIIIILLLVNISSNQNNR